MKSITESVYASGIVKSQNQYNVFSNVNGIIKEVYVDENDTVSAGTPLFSIANDAQILAEKNAKLNADFNTLSLNKGKLEEAQANLDLAKQKMQSEELMLTRQQNLWNQGIGSKVELEQREIALVNAKTVYQSAKQKYNDLQKLLNFSAQQAQNNLSISQKNASDYIVKSSISGKVYQINIHKGEMVSPQIPLAIIGDNKAYVLEMQVDEYDIVSIKMGMKVAVVLNSYKDTVFSAIVTKINPIMNAQSKTFTIEATFLNTPSILYPFISFEANILINTKKDALLIPRNYLYNDSIVFLKSGEQKIVRTGLKDFQMIEIISGINKEDEIILPKQ
ncbi:MAG: efflux RND transporter periplasmic adaptor subunit [Chitinophagaceae bacterium]